MAGKPTDMKNRMTKTTKTEKKPTKNRITRGVGFEPTPRRRPGR